MTWDDVLRRLYGGARILPRTKRNGQPTDSVLSTGEVVTRATTSKLLREGLVEYCGRSPEQLKISSKGMLFARDQVGIDTQRHRRSGIHVGATISVKANGMICRGLKIVEIKHDRIIFSKGGERGRWWLPMSHVKANIVPTEARQQDQAGPTEAA